MSESDDLQTKFDRAEVIAGLQPQEAVILYNEIISASGGDASIKEQAIYKLGELLAKSGQANELATLLVTIRPFFATISKAKTEKIVTSLIKFVSEVPNTLPLQIDLCKESISWCKKERRAFLRQRLQSRLAALYHDAAQYQDALSVIQPLLREVKRLGDKQLLVEINLIESRVQHSLRNIPKAKASLTSARTFANSIYCPPLLQGDIDMQSGILHCEEKDYKTAYSYFFEAFECLNSQDHPTAVSALKYMLLAKVMTNNPQDVHSILSGKLTLKYHGRDIDAMQAVAAAHRDRSLHQFEAALSEFRTELSDDPLIHLHLSELYDTMLQQNICRLIEPFSCVEISHVAELIGLDIQLIERKLSQMILDKKFQGILDQGNGWLILFPEAPSSQMYEASLETMDNMSKVVDQLYERAKLLR